MLYGMKMCFLKYTPENENFLFKPLRKKMICTQCNGKGHYQAIDKVLCTHCVFGRLPNGEFMHEPCPWCKGSGYEVRTVWKTCTTCGGSGTIYP